MLYLWDGRSGGVFRPLCRRPPAKAARISKSPVASSKSRPAPEVNLFRSAMKGLVIGILVIAMGQIATNTFWLFGILLTICGVAFPFVYFFMMVNVMRQTLDAPVENRPDRHRRSGQHI